MVRAERSEADCRDLSAGIKRAFRRQVGIHGIGRGNKGGIQKWLHLGVWDRVTVSVNYTNAPR